MTNVATDMQTHVNIYIYILYITFENKIKKYFPIVSKNMKYLQINLTKCYEIFIVKNYENNTKRGNRKPK